MLETFSSGLNILMQLASSLNNLGRVHKAMGDLMAAGKAYQEAADIYIMLFGEAHRYVKGLI